MAYMDCGFYSKSLMKNARILVFIPTMSADDYLTGNHADYYREHAKYQTLYLLHGSYGDCTDWTRFTNILRYAQERCLAVVMPSAENSCYINMAQGEPYLDYISLELPDFLSTLFPLSGKREDTFIAGLSMGGYGAFRIALEHPEKYACAASLSGAFGIPAPQVSSEAHSAKMPVSYRKAVFGDDGSGYARKNDLTAVLHKRLSEHKALPKLYLSCGTEDFIYPSNVEFYENAIQNLPDLIFEKHPGIHNWEYWDRHIQDVLEWLPLKRSLV